MIQAIFLRDPGMLSSAVRLDWLRTGTENTSDCHFIALASSNLRLSDNIFNMSHNDIFCNSVPFSHASGGLWRIHLWRINDLPGAS